MLAVVVDDHDMAVTHIIRGDDHLTNAARQRQIYDALGWPVPVMAHIPLIHGPDGSKLSKRHGALGVDAYRALGYLPAALRNYLVRLGWSHGDQEIFSTEEMIAAFDLPQIGRSPARFDFAKLESLNGHYIRGSDDATLLHAVEQLLPHIAGGDAIAAKMTPRLREQWLTSMPSLKERAKTLIDLIDGAHFLLADRPFALDHRLPFCSRRRRKRYCTKSASNWRRSNHGPRMRRNKRSVPSPSARAPSSARWRSRSAWHSPAARRRRESFEVLIVLGKAESLARIADRTKLEIAHTARGLIREQFCGSVVPKSAVPKPATVF